MSRSTTRQIHTVLGGGIRYETAELVLLTIPNFELKQKGRILHLFTEKIDKSHAFVQEIQDALDERQNQFDSLLAHNQVNTPLAEPFAFESQVDVDTHPMNLSLKSTDEPIQRLIETENNIYNETVPLLVAPNEKENERNQSKISDNRRRKSSWTSTRDSPKIKTEPVTPQKTKRRQSKTSSKSNRKNLSSSDTSMRQMTMTQLFDPVESPRSTPNLPSVKQEPSTPSDDTMMFMPESLIGLAQPSESMSDTENEQDNLSDLISPARKNNVSMSQSLKRKLIPSPITNENIPQQTTTSDEEEEEEEEEEEDLQNNALLRSPYSGIESDELLYACPMCRNYWLGLPEELRNKEGLTCRHRQRPVARTPEHFWSLGIPSTQTCIQRGYGGVLPPDKPIERPRRPRRQYQRRLQEQQQQEQNEEIDDEEN